MRKHLCAILAAAMLLVMFGAVGAQAKIGDEFPTTPVLNDGQKWRMAYYEGGTYPDYQVIFIAIVKGLIDLGWIEDMEFPEEYNPDHKAFWEWFCANVKSDYLEFVPDAFSSSDFEEEIRVVNRPAFIERLNTRKDIDLIFAMGTWAGQDLANDQVSVPSVVASCSNPLASGIIESVEDSGWDHIHAKMEPDRYERQVRLFHDIIGFQRLGIVYEDSEEGLTYGGIDSIKAVAEERGFEIVECLAEFSNVSKREARENVAACYSGIADKIDASYITVHRGVTLANIPNILGPLNANKVPTFSMKGSEEVKHGVLMSIAQAEFRYVGQFHAEVIAKILNGAVPRDITQAWNAPLKIALNLKTAEEIGFDPPVDILMAADEIYETIEVTEEER